MIKRSTLTTCTQSDTIVEAMKTYSRTHHGVSGNSRQWYDRNLWVEVCHYVTSSVW